MTMMQILVSVWVILGDDSCILMKKRINHKLNVRFIVPDIFYTWDGVLDRETVHLTED